MEIVKVETIERVVSVTTSTEPREAIITVQPYQPRVINVEGSHVVVGIPGKDFKYEDFTPEQLALLKGEKGDKGDKGEKGDGLLSVVAGDNISIDNTDPLNPIISAAGGGTTGDLTLEQARQNGNVLEGDVEFDLYNTQRLKKYYNATYGVFIEFPDESSLLIGSEYEYGISKIRFTGGSIQIESTDENFIGMHGHAEFNKQGDRKAFAQLSDVYDYYQLPEGATLGDVLVEGVSGVEWSNRLTTAENEIDTEIVNRALADALKLDKPTSPNNVATKVILGDGSTKNISDFSQVEQVEVGASGNAQEAWKGKLILITAPCTITIPTGLSNNWSCEIATLAGVTLTWAITSPKTWLFGTPANLPEKTMCTVSQRGNTNDIMLFGGYGI